MVCCIQDKKRKTQRGHNLADTIFFHDVFLTRCVYGATNVDPKVEDTYLEGNQQFTALRPILGVLQSVSHRKRVIT